MTHDFENLLSARLRANSVVRGSERVFGKDDVPTAIAEARRNGIAVLGIEVFKVLPDALQSMSEFSVYEIPFGGEWENFVEANAKAADEDFAQHCQNEHPDKTYGYILTTASECEFKSLKNA